MTAIYCLSLVLAAASSMVLAIYTAIGAADRLSTNSSASSGMNLIYAPLAALGFFTVLLGLLTIFSRRPIFSQIVGLGSASVLIVCAAMLLEALLTRNNNSFLSLTLPSGSRGFPLAWWIPLPLFTNATVLVLAQVRSVSTLSFSP